MSSRDQDINDIIIDIFPVIPVFRVKQCNQDNSFHEIFFSERKTFKVHSLSLCFYYIWPSSKVVRAKNPHDQKLLFFRESFLLIRAVKNIYHCC